MPIVRTVPFVAGVSSMPYLRYLTFCILGALIWVVSLCLAGYWFGQPADRQEQPHGRDPADRGALGVAASSPGCVLGAG